jgi:4-hydroxybenzoate polyprenyltransferase
MSRLRSLLATLRIANAPSVVSNVWLGYALGWALNSSVFGIPDSPPVVHASPLLLCLSGLLLYFAGNLANDWYDRTWDQVRRPERALPSGMFAPWTFLTGSVVLAAAGVMLAFIAGVSAGICSLVILASIALYTRIHKISIASVIPMGLCRAGLYFLGFLGTSTDPQLLATVEIDSTRNTVGSLLTLVPLAGGLLCYIAGLSLSARYEGMANPPKGPQFVSRGLLVVPVFAMSSIFMERPIEAFAGALPYLVWLTMCFTWFRSPVPRYVSALLAGIPLVDFIASVPLVWLSPASKSGGGISPMVTLLLPLVAFGLGRALQKLAPAT